MLKNSLDTERKNTYVFISIFLIFLLCSFCWQGLLLLFTILIYSRMGIRGRKESAVKKLEEKNRRKFYSFFK